MKKLEEIVKKLESITPERRRIAKIFKTHVERAVDGLGPGYMVDLQGDFCATPISITIEISRTQNLQKNQLRKVQTK